jgi:hypothetical protein
VTLVFLGFSSDSSHFIASSEFLNVFSFAAFLIECRIVAMVVLFIFFSVTSSSSSFLLIAVMTKSQIAQSGMSLDYAVHFGRQIYG